MSDAKRMTEAEVLKYELEVLRQEHRDLDTAITALTEKGSDPLTVRRLKKKKLAIKDQITRLSDRATPDIIA